MENNKESSVTGTRSQNQQGRLIKGTISSKVEVKDFEVKNVPYKTMPNDNAGERLRCLARRLTMRLLN